MKNHHVGVKQKLTYNNESYNSVRETMFGKYYMQETSDEGEWIEVVKHKRVKNNQFEEEEEKMIYFATNTTQGMPLRDPMHGHYIYDTRVGSIEVDQYFKVINHSSGAKNDHLYYETPEYFERHFKISLPQEVKTKFFKRNNMNDKIDDEDDDEDEDNDNETNMQRWY